MMFRKDESWYLWAIGMGFIHNKIKGMFFTANGEFITIIKIRRLHSVNFPRFPEDPRRKIHPHYTSIK